MAEQTDPTTHSTIPESEATYAAAAPESHRTPDAKGRRCTIDLSPAAASEVDRIRRTFGMSTAELFRSALVLVRLYADAKLEGKEVQIISPKKPRMAQLIELPFFAARIT